MREYDSMEEQRSEMDCIIIISFINKMSEIITILTFNEIRHGIDECGQATTGNDEYNGEAAQEAATGISQ